MLTITGLKQIQKKLLQLLLFLQQQEQVLKQVRASVILNEETSVKNIIFHPKFLPSIVILDPVLTLGLPAKITAATGMDALAHNLEAYCAPGYHPMADGIALEGMRLINDWLLKAFNNGSNIEARQNMLTAASMGSTAFQKGLGSYSLIKPSCKCSKQYSSWII